MNFNQFKHDFSISDVNLFAEFYAVFADSIEVKNKKIAVEKLSNIINATFKLSATQSFANMSLRQLADVSQMSLGGLYAYIKSKQQLSLFIHQFLNHYAEKIIQQIDSSDGENGLENLIRSHIYLSESMQPWFFFAFMESKNLATEQKKYAKQSELKMQQKIADAIIKGQQAGLYSQDLDAETVASHILPLLHDWYLKRWKYQQQKIGIEEYCHFVMLFINRSLQA